MNSGTKSARQLASLIGGLPSDNSICTSCLITISRRRYASTAAAVAEAPSLHSGLSTATQVASPQLAYQLRTGVVLSRPPVITRDLLPFEKSYFLYQRRLNERLALPFTRYFYFRKGTPADVEWKRKAKTRLTAARDIGVYNAYGQEGWNDELLVGDPVSEPEHQVEALLKDAEQPPVGGAGLLPGEAQNKSEPIEKPMARVTEADQAGDQKSLNRLLQRSLYMLVKNEDGRWTFPSDFVIGRENLHQAAERVLVQAAGVNMNTWVVGNAPVGHYQYDYRKIIPSAERGVDELGEKVFFMKARIMAGQADLRQTKYGLSDFKWLAREEVEKVVTPRYWSYIRNMLAER